MILLRIAAISKSELIDTLWNVNYESCEVDVIDFAN